VIELIILRKIGISLQASSETIVSDLEKALTAGFTHIELKWDNFVSQAEEKRTRTFLQNRVWGGVTISLHTPLQNVNIGSVTEVKRKKSVTRVTEAIGVAKELNTSFIVLHGGKIPAGLRRDQKTKERAFRAQLKSLKEINLFCKERGMVMALENGYTINDFGLLTSIDEMARLNELIEELSFLLDIGHFILNSPLPNIRAQFKRTSSLHFSGIHLHDNNGTYDDHLALGEGLLLGQEKELKTILKSINNCPIIVESRGIKTALRTRSNLLKKKYLI
jgi:sugar phosphate isomerase/epimerase